MGARQTGKSTLVQTDPFGEHRLYLTLDDPTVQERASLAADELVESAPRITLDEVQRAPDLLLAVKRAVDRDRPRRPGRFILTGSANLLLMQRVAESLAGRATSRVTPRSRPVFVDSRIWFEEVSSMRGSVSSTSLVRPAPTAILTGIVNTAPHRPPGASYGWQPSGKALTSAIACAGAPGSLT